MASPVTTVECLEDLKQVAVGLASGYVIIVYGNDISRDRFTHTRTLPPLDPSLPGMERVAIGFWAGSLEDSSACAQFDVDYP